MKTIKDINIRGKKIFLRTAYDVPVKNGKVADDFRIRTTIPTIEYLLKQNCKIIICGGWRGRPGGKVVNDLKMDAVAKRLGQVLKRKVRKLDDCIGPAVDKEVSMMKEGDIVLLENTRFHPEEDKNGKSFAGKLASLCEIMVMDAFAQSHRKAASIVGVAKFIPTVSGFLMEKEVSRLKEASQKPKKPAVLILGGIKLSDKFDVLGKLYEKFDYILCGGGVASNFFAVSGKKIGKSVIDKDSLKVAIKFISRVILPDDVLVSKSVDKKNDTETIDLLSRDIPHDKMIVDIGPKTIEKFDNIIKGAKTIIWNGPMGVFEVNAFAKGTRKIAEGVALNKNLTVVGGGDTISLIDEYKLTDKYSLVSTGGGATLEFLAKGTLPGIEIIPNK